MEDWIKQLNLKHLDHESGLFAVEHLSKIEVALANERLPASNCIFYALTREFSQNHLHWLASDDHHVLIHGGPADYYLFFTDGSVRKETLGSHWDQGQRPLVIAPGGCRKAIQLHRDAASVLVASIVTPAWSPDRVKFGGSQTFIDQYRDRAGWATPQFLRALIGPNWQTD